jgi:hypothetical protein
MQSYRGPFVIHGCSIPSILWSPSPVSWKQQWYLMPGPPTWSVLPGSANVFRNAFVSILAFCVLLLYEYTFYSTSLEQLPRTETFRLQRWKSSGGKMLKTTINWMLYILLNMSVLFTTLSHGLSSENLCSTQIINFKIKTNILNRRLGGT